MRGITIWPLYGCNYGDDPRLVEDPEGTLQALYDGTIKAPVQVTHRTLLNMGPSTRDIISNNITVASMEVIRILRRQRPFWHARYSF